MTPYKALETLWAVLMYETEGAIAVANYPAFIEACEAHDVLLEYLDNHEDGEILDERSPEDVYSGTE